MQIVNAPVKTYDDIKWIIIQYKSLQIIKTSAREEEYKCQLNINIMISY